MSTISLRFALEDLPFTSYQHTTINSYIPNNNELNEIVQPIKLRNLLNLKEEFTLTYIYYETSNGINGFGYLTGLRTTNFRAVFTISETVADLLSSNLFRGKPYDNINNIYNVEHVYMYDNSTGNTVKFTLTIENGIVTIIN